jgi:chromosome partitioning protein|nr:MAG TPA: ParA [Caudoviricetes sp.]
MRIIGVMSPKGGIGKTTTSDSIAYILGEEFGKRVLILEGDQQGDTSETFGCYEPEGIGMSELIEKHVSVGGRFRTTDTIKATRYPHIDIIPANGYLMQTDMNLLMKSAENQIFRLRDALAEVADAYDYCICDCGRLFDMVVVNILMAAEMVIVPVKVGGYEIRAITNLSEQIEDLRQINPELRIKAILTMRQKNKTSLDFEDWLKNSSGFDTFVTPVRRSVIAERATIEMRPLPEFSPRSIASQDYRNIVHELLKETEVR